MLDTNFFTPTRRIGTPHEHIRGLSLDIIPVGRLRLGGIFIRRPIAYDLVQQLGGLVPERYIDAETKDYAEPTYIFF